MVHLLDTPEKKPEVRIEARIVEINDVYEQDLGIKWVAGYNGDGSGGTIKGALGMLDSTNLNNGSYFDAATTIFPNVATTALNAYGGAGAMIGLLDNALRLDIQLHALESLGEAQIIESPKVRVLNNETATLEITTSIPQSNPTESTDETGNVTITSTIEYKDFATKLIITPTVNPDNTIKLDLDLTHNTQGEPVVLTNQSGIENTYYTEFKKNLITKVLVDNRDTIVIGGLYRKESNSTEVGLPASDILYG
jgi:type IV pilus assembly protein PilQ